MTGWPAVVTTTGLMLVALTGFNLRLWRRMKAATAAARRAEARAAARPPSTEA